jgi:hypothetical protein
MQQFFNNRYVQLAGLTIGIGILFFALIWLICMAIGLKDFPIALQLTVAFLASGVVVYKFFAGRIF